MRKIAADRPRTAMLALVTSWGRRLLGMESQPGASASGRDTKRARVLSMHFNAGALMANAVVSSALGYPFWLIAARIFDPNEVGLGLGLIAAMRLCAQVALLGIGAAIIILLPRREFNPTGILNTAFTMALGTTLITATGFVLLSSVLFDKLNRISSSPFYVATFIALCVVAVMSLLFDSTFNALRRSDRVLMRSVAQGLAALGILGILGLVLNAGGVSSILLAWVGALSASTLAGYRYLRIFMPEFRFRLFTSRRTSRAVFDVGLRNAALNVTSSAPLLVIPIVITEVLSPSENAYWYAAWMFAGLASVISNSATTALFSELTNRPDLASKRARQTIRMCLILSIPVALGLAVFGEIGLRLMGKDYAAAGMTPLRILLIGTLARPFIATYVTEQRSANRYAEPTLFAAINGVTIVAGAAIGGALYGLNGAATARVVAGGLAAVWAAWRLRHIWTGSTKSDVLGEAWFHIPKAGKFVLWLKGLNRLWLVIGGIVGVSVLGDRSKRRKRKHGKGLGDMTGRASRASTWWGIPVRDIFIQSGLAAITISLVALAIYSYRQPTHETLTRERPQYTHTATFDYTAQMERSTLYPNGVLGPITADETVGGTESSVPANPAAVAGAVPPGQASGTAGVPQIYHKLARTMDLGVGYALQSPGTAEVTGTYRADLVIQAGEQGWTTSEELIPPTPFEGSAVSFQSSVDIQNILTTLATIEEETGFKPASYTISMIPTIQLEGSVGAQPIQEFYAPEFAMTLDATTITPPEGLSTSREVVDLDLISRERSLTLAEMSLPVTQLRLASSLGALLTLAVAAGLGYLTIRRFREDESAMVQMRYGSMLVSVTGPNTKSNLESIRLASIQDLARLAERDSKIIFHQQIGPNGHRYFVQHGRVIYEYMIVEHTHPSIPPPATINGDYRSPDRAAPAIRQLLAARPAVTNPDTTVPHVTSIGDQDRGSS